MHNCDSSEEVLQMTLEEANSRLDAPPCVLLVEDSPDDAYFFQRALIKSGAQCDLQHVSDGGAAIEFLRRVSNRECKSPDWVFLDLKMPVLSGFEVLEWIRTQPFAGSLRVVVLSGSDQEADRERAFDLGALDYLVKPVSCADLTKRLQSLSASATIRA
jgi:CheY-like chemotaxis protein